MELKLNSSFGSMNAELMIHKTGKDIMIGFNPKFLIDALRVIDDEGDQYLHDESKVPMLYQGRGCNLHLSDPSGQL